MSELVPQALPIHDAIRRQLTTDIGGARLLRLQGVLDRLTFSVVLHWLTSERRASPNTKQGYADDVARFAEWAGEFRGQHPVQLLTGTDKTTVTAWTLHARHADRAVRTQRRTLYALRSLFNYAARNGFPVTSPVSTEDHIPKAGTSNTGRPEGATPVLDLVHIVALRQAAQTDEEHLIFDLLYLHGLRESELVEQRLENVDRDRSPVRFQVKRKGSKWIQRDLAADTAASFLACVGDRREGPMLLDPKTGTGRTRFQIIDTTRRLARRAGLARPTKVTPHVLRATAITALFDASIALHEIQAWAGHADPKTTRMYWERANAARRDAALSSTLATGLDHVLAGLIEPGADE
ncbi:tyrosine-type recombinase/integrase [Actinophytocola sp.]|uniref:tyrosine-type recombinase/integrase n=1 Tax=Actinophytocola sp. TaxID=1872138 RepID=UPI002ED28969